MKNFFDDVFDNKFLFEKEDLLRSFNEELKEKEAPLKNIDMVDATLETMMHDFRQNPERPFTAKEAKIIKAKLEAAKEEGKRLLNVIKDRKENLNEKIKSSNNSFTLDISRSHRLKKSATNIFGGIKKEVTYDDYMALIELKKLIEMSESLDLIQEGLDDGRI